MFVILAENIFHVHGAFIPLKEVIDADTLMCLSYLEKTFSMSTEHFQNIFGFHGAFFGSILSSHKTKLSTASSFPPHCQQVCCTVSVKIDPCPFPALWLEQLSVSNRWRIFLHVVNIIIHLHCVSQISHMIFNLLFFYR